MAYALRQPFAISTPAIPHPVRVLHVLGGMNPGGVETWLLQVLQNINRNRVQMDFWVHNPEPGLYDPEIQALGSRIFVAPPITSPQYLTTLWHTLKQVGPYQVIHSHIHHFSGWVLQIAKWAGVPIRIAHSHLDTRSLDYQSSFQRRCYLWLMQQQIRQCATVGVSASELAAAALFDQDWQQDPRWQILHCGIDLEPFKQQVDRARLRASFQIPEDALVIGHVGRFQEQKNHCFLVDIVAAALKQQSNTYLFLIGEGGLRPEIQVQVQQLGIENQVIFAGIRRDVPQLMQGLMDVFVLPSFQEGLPLVLLEAQVAGLPCVITNTITQEVDLFSDLITRCSLRQPSIEWANAVFNAVNRCQRKFQQSARQYQEQFEQSSFNINASVKALESLYLQSQST